MPDTTRRWWPDHEFVARAMAGQCGIGPALFRAAAGAAEPAYAAAVAWRNHRFDRTTQTCPLPAVSVGNLTAGGTGKTPVVRWLCGELARLGRRPAVVTRGYRGGDEARELGHAFADDGLDVPVIVDADRRAGAAAAAGRGADCVVLDDGFQHRRCGRRFDLVLVDATRPFGHGRLLPRGLLREPMGALRRADAVLLTRSNLVNDPARAALRQLVNGWPTYEATTRIGQLIGPQGDHVEPRRVVAFCGVGNSAGFFADLRRRLPDAVVTAEVAFPDHYAYAAADLRRLRELDLDADALVTTAKDAVKLSAWAGGPPPVVRAELALAVSGGAALVQAVDAALFPGPPRPPSDVAPVTW